MSDLKQIWNLSTCYNKSSLQSTFMKIRLAVLMFYVRTEGQKFRLDETNKQHFLNFLLQMRPKASASSVQSTTLVTANVYSGNKIALYYCMCEFHT